MVKKVLLWGVVIIVSCAVIIYFVRNILVERAIEEGTTQALGVETGLSSAELSIGAGSLTLHDFVADNPADFKGGDILKIGMGKLNVETGSVFSDPIVVDSLVLDDIRVHLEQIDDKNNFLPIMTHIRNQDFGTPSEGSSKKLKIGLIAIRSVEVEATLTLLGENQYDKTFGVQGFAMTDVGGRDGVTMSELTAKIVEQVLTRAASAGKGQLSGKLADNLSRLGQGKLEEIGSDVEEKIKDLGGSLLGGDKKK